MTSIDTGALDYLQGLPAYVMNLDRSPGRWADVQTHIEPHVASVTRVSALDGQTIADDDVLGFKADALAVLTQNPEMRITPRKTLSYWRGTMGCYYSHVLALTTALSDGHERFLIMEDDARLRPDLARVTPVPSQQGAYVWGGALKGGGYTAHARRALAGPTSNEWRAVPQEPRSVRDRYQAHALELDAESADRWLQAILAHPQAYDSAWWFAMLDVPTYVPQTEVWFQDLVIGSDRSPATGAFRQRMAKQLADEELL